MKITYKNYTLELETNSKERFNVFKTVEAKKENSKNPTSEKSVAWAISLERALQIIINDDLSTLSEKAELNDYIEAYKSATKFIVNEINKIK